MKFLFIANNSSTNYNAYIHRILSLKNSIEKNGITTDILYLKDLPINRPTMLYPMNFRTLIKKLNNYDFIHGGNTGATYVAGMLKPFINRDVKIIYDVHGDVIAEAKLVSHGIFDVPGNVHIAQAITLETIAERVSDYYVVCSEPLKDMFIRKGKRAENISVVHNGVDTELFSPGSKEDNNIFTVTYAGKFQKWQGIDLLVEAARLLADERIRFRIIGFDDHDRAIKAKISRMLGEKAVLVDNLPKDELIRQLNASDALVIPRERNPTNEAAFPTKYAEYIATATPVIVTNVGEIASLTSKYDCGLVCEPDPRALADSILKLKDAGKSKLAEMGTNGRNLSLDMFNYDNIGYEYYQFIKNKA